MYISAFWEKWFLRRRFLKYFPIQGHVKTVSPIVTLPHPGGQDFNKLAFVLYQTAFKQILAFLA
jgi:hypothetical protein